MCASAIRTKPRINRRYIGVKIKGHGSPITVIAEQGRNEKCKCGSGLKYKCCCNLMEKNLCPAK